MIQVSSPLCHYTDDMQGARYNMVIARTTINEGTSPHHKEGQHLISSLQVVVSAGGNKLRNEKRQSLAVRGLSRCVAWVCTAVHVSTYEI